MAKTKKATVEIDTKITGPVETKMVPLTKINSNTAQSRGMGVLPNLQEAGWGLFESLEGHMDQETIWDLLTGEHGEEGKAKGVTLVGEHELGIVNLADGIRQTGQLQAIGVVEEKDSTGYDILYGARRAVAVAYNHARDESAPDSIECKVFSQDFSAAEKRLLAMKENDDREDESPVEKGMSFAWLVKEQKLTPEQVGKEVGCGHQHVRDLIKVATDPLLEDVRMKIHKGEMGVDPALKLLILRKEKGKDAEPTRTKKASGRFRFPGVKGLIRIYEAGKKPKGMKEEEWELWTSPDVRKLMALRLGLRFSEWEASPEKESKHEDNGEQNEPAVPSKIIKIKRERAVELLLCLGKTDVRTWDNDKIKTQLESVVNLVEPGQQLEIQSLQNLLDKLVEGYSQDLKVEILPDKVKEKK